MKKILLICAVLFLFLTASAQELYQMGGIYTPYPDAETVWHKAPAGYKAVYLAHFGRHGSRYHTSARHYETLLAILEKGEAAGVLTEEGKSLLPEVRKIAEDARGHYGALVPLGYEEHRHIMQRFCKRYPELFSGASWNVEVFASQRPRCLVSMATSTDVIKEFNPKVQFIRQSDDAVQDMLFSNEKTHTAFSNARAYIDANLNMAVNTQPLIDKFFTDGGKYIKPENRRNFGAMVIDIAAAALEAGTDIWKYFTKEEIAPFWKQHNTLDYYQIGPSEEFSEVSNDMVRNLLLNMLTSSDEALSGGRYRASLRYGHDTQILALTHLLGIEGCSKAAAPGQAVEEVWRDYEVSPMAANIQMLFFRKGSSDDVLVKVMHNEVESYLEGISTDCWPFYHWSDVRRILYDKVEKLPSFKMNGWQCDTLSPGLVYMRYSGYEKVSRANQIISVAVVDLNNPRYSIDFSYAPGRNSTSEAFKAAGASVSMNAGYERESVVIKTEDTMHWNIQSDIVPFVGAFPQWKSDCAICTDGRRVSIEYTGKDKTIQEMREAYSAMEWPEILSSSPMLIEKGVPVGKYFAASNLTPEEINELNYEDPLRHQAVRHPRCAVAITDDNHLILICVDGRRPGIAEGMNAWELTSFLETQFHPVDAINMDGGGSSAMCVKGHGHPVTNVVSYPSKVPVFNHSSERRVPTHIHIIDTKAEL